MRTITALTLVTLLLVALSAPLPGATVTLESVNGITDGSSYVGPLTLVVDGITYTALCYDYNNKAYVGETWNAVLYSFSDLSSAYFSGQSDYYIKYQEAAWLFTQLLQTTNSASIIGIQHAVWNLFTNTASTAGAAVWLAAAEAAAASGFTGTNFDSFQIVNSPTGSSQVQGFLIANYASASTTTPEPAAFVLLGAGLILIGGLARRFRATQRD